MEISIFARTVFDKLKDPKGYVSMDEYTLHKHKTEELEDLLDLLGEQSMKARGLKHPVTSSVKLTKNQILYLLVLENQVAGFAKVQRNKKLFKPGSFGSMQEYKLTAIVDFYIHPSFEGRGHGKKLLEHILATEHFPNNQIGFFKISNSFVKFVNSWFKTRCVIKPIEDDFYVMQRAEEKKPAKSPEMKPLSKHLSQTNLNALSSSIKEDKTRSRGHIFNSIAKDVIGQSTPDLSNYEPREEFKSNNGQQTARNQRLNFDEYLAEYEKAKQNGRNKSPSEHRSKYFNDVFSSSINFSNKNQGMTTPFVEKIMKEIPRHERTHYEHDGQQHLNVFQQDNGLRDQYIPDIPAEFKKTIDEKDLTKPKNRFKNWQPIMRNLESTYDVKDVNLRSYNYSPPEQEVIDPSRRVQMGGKKLFMSKKEGIERANNFSSGYMAPSYR